MRKLYELKAAVEGLAKTVTTPDADLDLTVSSSLSTQSFSSTTFKGATDLNTLLGKVRTGNNTFVLWRHCSYTLTVCFCFLHVTHNNIVCILLCGNGSI